jgi:hypothetical protein
VTFNNNQQIVVNRKGYFDIFRPSLSNFASYPPFQPVKDGLYLQLGFGTGGSTNSGNMSFSALISSQYSGRADFTQLITGSYTNGTSVTGPRNGFQLDNDPFVTGGNAPGYAIAANASTNVIFLSDAPGVQLDGSPSAMNLSYHSYARFIPDGVSNIVVTLGVVNWSVNTATSLVTNSGGEQVFGPPTGGVPDGQPALIDSALLPEWSDVFHNHEVQ